MSDPASSEGGRFCAYCDEPILPTGKCTTFVKLSNSAGGWTLEPDSVAYGREGFLSDGSG
ncbi:hypothetical protein AB0J38_37270 [Streptomyces sp. NPDC050095]|uniref:hypothetical protein n=1 Tax=unclassified Streptomyces TaxID=2593676 RepID=UPI00343BEB9C